MRDGHVVAGQDRKRLTTEESARQNRPCWDRAVDGSLRGLRDLCAILMSFAVTTAFGHGNSRHATARYRQRRSLDSGHQRRL